MTKGGTWRDHSILPASDLLKVSKELELSQAATLLINPPTAYRLLNDFVALKEGDVLVQNGATSHVGKLVIQLAKGMGVKTINLVSLIINVYSLDNEGWNS